MKPEEIAVLKPHIASAVKEGLEATNCGKCPLPQELVKEMGHFGDAIKSLGDGDMSHGIERFREYLQFIKWIRKTGEKVGNRLLWLIVGAGFVAFMLWLDLGHLAGKITGK